MNEKYLEWKNYKDLDIELKTELENLSAEEIEEVFYKNLDFGTAGLRAKLGVGTNRLNIYVVRKATEGFANYIEATYKENKIRGVAIGYDNRKNSLKFAFESAKVLANHGIKSYVFDALRPTPELSFAVRHLNCVGGIMITASHNPKEYNGYKIYDKNGCQFTIEEANKVTEFVNHVPNELEVKVADEAVLNQYLNIIGEGIDKEYYKNVKTVQINPDLDKKDIKIVFTPEHGTSNIPVRTLFSELGYNIIPVLEQCEPDTNFSNTITPNPENKEAYNLAIEYAKTNDADLVIATDPDADRLGIAVRHQGEYKLLTGNQTGAILLEYKFSQLSLKNQMPKNPIIFNTIVTSDFGMKVAKKYGVEVESTLTGFKFIGEKIEQYKDTDKTFLFGYEESYGYLLKGFVRDKDAMQACVIIAECANYYKQNGKTLVDVLEELYEEHGCYIEDVINVQAEGIEGANRIKNIMKHFRDNINSELAGVKIIAKEDYKSLIRYENGHETKLTLPNSDVIKLFFEDGSWVAIRPSGTEPKCKFYLCIKGTDKQKTNENLKYYKDTINAILENIFPSCN